MQPDHHRSPNHACPLNLVSDSSASHHSLCLSTHRVTHHKCLNPCTFNFCAGSCGSTARPVAIEHRPFSGGFRGMTWNARAFFARDGRKMSRRMAKTRQMAMNLDFFGIQETHSTPERAAAVQSEFKSHVLFWSHCSLQKGGLLLGISKQFTVLFRRLLGWR